MRLPARERNDYHIRLFLIALLLATVLCLLVLACTPPFSRDALIHHLQVPKLYLQHGSIFELPNLIFSYYPMNLELLYMGPLYFGNDILPKYIHMAFGLATAILLHKHLKKRISLKYAHLGSTFFLSIPIIVKLSTTVYVDLGLVFFSTASLLLLFKWIERCQLKRNLILAGICGGLAIGTKYNGLLVVFLLTSFVPILFIRSTNRVKGLTTTPIQAGILFLFFALLTTSPWLIRNTLWTGNPIYPLYDGFFNPPSLVNITNATNEQSVRGVFATRYVLYGENLVQLVLLPIRIFFEGVDDVPRYFDGRLNPFLLLLPCFSFLGRQVQHKQIHVEKIALLIFCLLYFFFAFNTGVLRIRYLAPMIPFLVILAMYGLHNIEKLTKKYLNSEHLITLSWLLVVCFMLTLNAIYLYQQFQKTEPLSYIAGRLTRDEYLTKYRPEYKIMQYANTQLPNSAKILCIFMGGRGYYLNRKHYFDQHVNSKWLLSWIQEPKITESIILKRLLASGISHLLIRKKLLSQWSQHVTSHQRLLLSNLIKNHLIPLASYQTYTLYKIN